MPRSWSCRWICVSAVASGSTWGLFPQSAAGESTWSVASTIGGWLVEGGLVGRGRRTSRISSFSSSWNKKMLILLNLIREWSDQQHNHTSSKMIADCFGFFGRIFPTKGVTSSKTGATVGPGAAGSSTSWAAAGSTTTLETGRIWNAWPVGVSRFSIEAWTTGVGGEALGAVVPVVWW